MSFLGLLYGGLWLGLALGVVFVLIPLAELVLPAPMDNPDGQEIERRLEDPRYDAVIYLAIPVQIGLILFLLHQVSTGALAGLELGAAIFSIGLSNAGFGINTGHELGHRAEKHHQIAAKFLLGTTLYAHFFIEHNRGHHARVATPDDPATSRKGEWVQAFWLRSMVGGFRSAWDLEASRLGRKGESPWSLGNEMLRIQALQVLAVASAVVVFGPLAAAVWMGSALVAGLMLETINYLEHYGLLRERNERGRWARVAPHHSWNSNCILGRLLTFELTRHSDHHAHPKRAYPGLRHFDDTPQLPTGYPGMMVLSLCPPLFFALMDPRLSQSPEEAARTAAA
jgi:alkane 1-monooxygenase